MNISKIRVGFLAFVCFFLLSKAGISQINSFGDAVVVPTEIFERSAG